MRILPLTVGAFAVALLSTPICAEATGPLAGYPAAPPASQQGGAASEPQQTGGSGAQRTSAPAAQQTSAQHTGSPAQTSATPSVPAVVAAAKGPAEPANKAEMIEVPSGTRIPLVLHNAVSTRSARPGDPVYFETLFPVIVNQHVVIPAGSYVSGEITEAKRAGRVKGRAELMIRLTTLIMPNAYIVSFIGTPNDAGTGGHETTDNEGKIRGDTNKASDAATMIKTTGAGAGIGAIAGGAKGAGIGAGAGAGIGLLATLLTRGPDAELPRGTTLDVSLSRPLFLDPARCQFTSPGQASTLPGPPNREPQRSAVPF